MSMRIRVLPRFPALITGTNGLTVVRDGVDLVVKPDYGALTQVPAVITPSSSFFAIWDEGQDMYIRMSFDDVFAAVVDLGFMATDTYDPQGIEDDAFERANHTGTQAISTVTGLQTALNAKADEADTDTPNLPEKTTPVDADGIRIWDSVGAAFKLLTFANLKAWILTELANLLTKTGTVIAYAGNAAPTGYLKCNGAAVSRTTYSALFSLIGTTYGAGDGSTTFNVPDLRGEFVRGWDDGRGVDSGRAFASAQLDQFQGFHLGASGGNKLTMAPLSITGGASNAPYVTGSDYFVPVSNGTNGTPRTGSETRARNIALLYCIKT